MTYKLRASYSYLNMWSTGRWEDAIKAYFKLDRFVTREMAEGSDYHAEWDKHIQKTKRLPDVFGGGLLNNPKTEIKDVIPVYDWLDLVIKPDCVDSPIVYEWKTGTLESSDYARTFQPSIYAVGLLLQKIPVQYIDIYAYNQYSKKVTYSRIENTEKRIRDGFEYIETVGSEMHTYFLENGLYEKYARV